MPSTGYTASSRPGPRPERMCLCRFRLTWPGSPDGNENETERKSTLHLLEYRYRHPELARFWMTMFSRITPEASPKLGFTPLELKLLDAAVSDKILRRRSFADYLNKLACLGGYLSRSHDPPPGNQVVGAASDGSPTRHSEHSSAPNLWVNERFRSARQEWK